MSLILRRVDLRYLVIILTLGFVFMQDQLVNHIAVFVNIYPYKQYGFFFRYVLFEID